MKLLWMKIKKHFQAFQSYKNIFVNSSKNMVRTKLDPKRVIIRRWSPREQFTEYKIKTLLPKQKTKEIKKNGEVVRTVTVKRKAIKFTDHWARNF